MRFSYMFLFISALSLGSTHDSTAFEMSLLSTLCNRRTNGLLKNYWIVADEAYFSSRRILSPCPGRNLPVAKDYFNYRQSSARIHIE